MKKSIKKGFTLVELLVVIAIIAILSVVGIVGYVSFTNRARISNDTTIVTELNRVMQAEHVNKDVKNMQQIVNEVHDAGFILTKLTPTASKHHIVYDMAQDRFFLLNESYKVVASDPNYPTLSKDAWDHWKVVQSYEEVENNDTFSYYLGEMKNPDTSRKLNVKTGIDVGDNVVAEINYTNTDTAKNDVVIRTNGGALTVNAPADTVNHYGYAEVLDIQAIAGASYHEYGTSGFARLKQGHFVVESEGVVNVIYATGTKSGETAVIVDNNNGIIGKAYATQNETANLLNNVEQEGQTGNVVLEKYDAVITESIITAMNSTSIVEELNNTESSAIKTTIEETVASSSFRGEGTSANPYLISNINELEILRQRVAGGNEYTGKHFKLTRNIDMSSIANWPGIGTGAGSAQYCFEGVFDGDGKTISGLRANNNTSEGFGLFSYIRNATIKNFTISDANIVSTKKIGIAIGMSFGNVDIEDITIESNCSISGTGVIGGVVGNIAVGVNDVDSKASAGGTFIVRNLTNKASVACTAASQSKTQRVGGVIGNIQSIDKANKELLVLELNNLKNEGTVTCDYSSGVVGAVQSSFDLTRASYNDDIIYRVMKFVNCTNTCTSVKGEMIGYVDTGAKRFEFNKCKVSSDNNNYVSEWNGKLIYVDDAPSSYSVNLFWISNGVTTRTYLIATHASEVLVYGTLTNSLIASRSQFEVFMNNHIHANNESETSYSWLNESFGNGHGLIDVAETTEGLFTENTAGGSTNDLCYTPKIIIEVVGD